MMNTLARCQDAINDMRSLLLLNVVVILIVSYTSDNWLVLRIRNGSAGPAQCNITHLKQYDILHCPNVTYGLIEHYASLFRVCNDLTARYRTRAFRDGLVYPNACLIYLAAWSSQSKPPWSINWFAAVLATLAVCILIIAFVVHRTSEPNKIAGSLVFVASTYQLSIIIALYELHSSNTQEPRNEEDSMRYIQAGWAIWFGVLGSWLSGGCAFAFHTKARARSRRARSIRRRRQIHNAIMSAATQDIALAIRAKMTVV